MDLNLIIQQDSTRNSEKEVIDKVRTCLKLGYNAIALCVELNSDYVDGKDKIPEPFRISFHNDKTEKMFRDNYRLLTRLTVSIQDSKQLQRLIQSTVSKKYDILSVQTSDKTVFEQLCACCDIDIISLNLSSKLPFHFKRPQLFLAFEKGLCFEINYATCLRDRNSRIYTISNGKNLVESLKGKGIILSSGAWTAMELRGNKDIQNFGLLFGFNAQSIKNATVHNCTKVMSHSEMRRKTCKGVISIEAFSDTLASDKWLLKSCHPPECFNKDSDLENVSEKKVDLENVSEKKVKRKKLK